MSVLAVAAIVFVALLHLWFLVLEMFLWTKPFGRRVFGTSVEESLGSAKLAANQGLYNGFLAAGLLWAAASGSASYPLSVFFLSCVIVAGIFGARTAKRTILYVQAMPAAIALALVWLAHR